MVGAAVLEGGNARENGNGSLRLPGAWHPGHTALPRQTLVS